MEDIKTISLCETCYRHCAAERVTRADGVYLVKTCEEHGVMQHMVERDIEFYQQLHYDVEGYTIPHGIINQITNCWIDP